MSDTNDTVDGLLAEFRGYSAGMPPGYHVTMSWRDFRVMLDRLEAAHERELAAGGDAAKLRKALTDAEKTLYDSSRSMYGIPPHLHALLARIRAALATPATAEKPSAVGDSAKLREALSDACYAMFNFLKAQYGPCYREMAEALDKGKAALAVPPRNCDRFATVEDARKAHEAICGKYSKCHNGCPLNNEEHYSAFDCFEAWLFAPVADREGGNDGN